MEYITIPKLAEILNVTRQTVYYWVKNGKVQATKVGGTWIIDDPELTTILSGNVTEKQKQEIREAVEVALKQYNELYRRLAKE